VDGIEIEQPWLSALGSCHGRTKQTLEQGMGSIRPRLELWMRLRPDKVRVVRTFDEFDQSAVG
jgi:hypothetical protein